MIIALFSFLISFLTRICMWKNVDITWVKLIRFKLIQTTLITKWKYRVDSFLCKFHLNKLCMKHFIALKYNNFNSIVRGSRVGDPLPVSFFLLFFCFLFCSFSPLSASVAQAGVYGFTLCASIPFLFFVFFTCPSFYFLSFALMSADLQRGISVIA